MQRKILLLTMAAICVSGGAERVNAADADVIAYRAGIMKSLNEHTAAIGQILSSAAPDDNAVSHLEAIALLAQTAPRAFEPKVQGGEARPEVWTNWPDFSKRMKDFVEKTSAAAKVAKEQGKDAALGNILDALDCKSCHDKYRKEKK